jgi:hypothetical protein
MAREPTLFALFSTQAEAGVNELAAAGFGPDEIGFLAPGDAGEPNTGRNAAVGIGRPSGEADTEVLRLQFLRYQSFFRTLLG